MMPVRRDVLRVLAGAVFGAAPALSALAQGETSAIGAESRGAASRERRLVGKGPLGVALMVPPDGGIYRRAGQALIAGVLAAHARDGASVTLEIVEIDEDIAALRTLYGELQRRGFSMVIGPLTRSAVNLIAGDGPPPVFTLALNQPERGAIPANMLSFSVSIEAEARQAASIAWDEAATATASRRPRAAVVQDATALGRRAAVAFAARWRDLGGDIYEPIDVATPTVGRLQSAVSRLKADVFFVAASPGVAGALRIALGGRATIYGTSTLNSGAVQSAASGAAESSATTGARGRGARNAEPEPAPVVIRSPELDGVRLVDMPWQVQPDSLAVMAYEKPAAMHMELQKLYALGIDAFRLAVHLLQRDAEPELDGVTGRLRLPSSDGGVVDREGVLAEYREGVLVPVTLQ
jgi:outer membrane PBP1 activator LpoA protein